MESVPRLLLALPLSLVLVAAPAAADLITNHLASDAEMLEMLSDTLFIGEGRIGDRGGSGTFEIDLGRDTGDPEATAQYDWQSGVPVPFTLTYNYITNEVVFGVGDSTLTWMSTLSGYSDIFVRTRAVVANSEIIIQDLILDGEAVNDTAYAVGSGGLDILWIHGGTLGDGFEITGLVVMTWAATPPTQSQLAFQIKVGKLKGVPVERTSWGRFKSFYH